jgi:hypothetical protein
LMNCATVAAWLRQSLSASRRIVHPLLAMESTVKPSAIIGTSDIAVVDEENNRTGPQMNVASMMGPRMDARATPCNRRLWVRLGILQAEVGEEERPLLIW